MTHRILNWLLAAAVIAAWMTMAASFDKKRFEGDERHEKAVEARFARAAQEVCGPNSTWRETNHKGEIVCLTKRNQPTKTAMVTK